MHELNQILPNDYYLLGIIGDADQLNRKVARFLRSLSRYAIGMVLVVLLVPFAIVLFAASLLATRASLEYLSIKLSRIQKALPETSERNLMQIYVIMEKIDLLVEQQVINLGEDDNTIKKAYFNLAFGSSWSKSLSKIDKIKSHIEREVYPDMHKKPSGEQVERLLKAYEGLEV